MHLRLSTVRRDNKTYRYAQLVESYRREEDGRPTHRILASLGALDDEAIANLRAALEVNRSGGTLVVSPKQMAAPSKPVVRANYRYLDLAVLLRVWKESGIARLLSDLLVPGSEGDVGADQVIAALMLHRCVAPGSKLAAAHWFPTTALPELLGVAPGQFNNSRVHRALEALELVDATLQTRLPHVVQRTQGASVRLFIDATDTWFVGAGPPLAAKGVDKQGLYRKRVGIVLLCDDRGFPMRWHTLSGNYHDPTALLEMAVEAGKLDWVGDKPIVLDRAAGNAAAVETLHKTGMRFLTALPWSEFVSSGAPIPWDKIGGLQAACEVNGTSPDSIVQAATAAGFENSGDDRFVLDLGVFDKAPAQSSDRPSAAVGAMRFARRIKDDEGMLSDLAAEFGVTVTAARRHRRLLQLADDIQLRVLAGQADAIGSTELRMIAQLAPSDQLPAFEAAIALHPDRVVRARGNSPGGQAVTRRTRGVLYFNAKRFLEKRSADNENLIRVRAYVAELNLRLASKTNHSSDGSALAAAHKRIVRFGLGAVLIPRLGKQDGLRIIALDFDESAWARRRQAHGVTLLVGHPNLPGTAADLVTFYFSKDVVEKDFQTIKSAIELRPIHHHTDIKLRAHVAICMLALLTQRILCERLKITAPGRSALAALETLETAHLNRVASGKTEFYTITELTQSQQSLLAALAMEDLAQDDRVAANISPR